MMYFRLDANEAKQLAALAESEIRPVADITRRAVTLYLRGGAEEWAKIEAQKRQGEKDALSEALASAVRSDRALSESFVELAAEATERQEVRTLLLTLARVCSPRVKGSKQRAKDSGRSAQE